MKTIADLIARVKEIDHFTNSDFAAEARQLLPAVVEMLEECMRQRESCQFLLRTGTVYRSVDVDSHKLNSKMLEIAKKHGVVITSTQRSDCPGDQDR